MENTVKKWIATETDGDLKEGDILVENWICDGRWLTLIRESDGEEFDSEVTQSCKPYISNLGRIITDYYCGGFFGGHYNLENSKIVAEGSKWIVIETTSGEPYFGVFEGGSFTKEYFLNEYCK